jgi:hypothetical protein
MDPTYTSEADGSVIRRLRRGPVLVNELKRMSDPAASKWH